MITAHALPAPTLPKAFPPQPHTTNQTAPTHRSIARDRTSGPRPFAIHPNFPPACALRLPYRPKPTSPPIPHAKPLRDEPTPVHTVRRQPSAVATPRPPPPPTARGGLQNKTLHHALVFTRAPLPPSLPLPPPLSLASRVSRSRAPLRPPGETHWTGPPHNIRRKKAKPLLSALDRAPTLLPSCPLGVWQTYHRGR